ncbi:hypothetical protein BV20DRAFT_965689 [Pilatotrama ljubarskyi]|nr:hypothetical protein BV20DRAFT_965689 [Pilatotrama ljubarskyi]
MASLDVTQQQCGPLRVLFDKSSLPDHDTAETAAATRATIAAILPTKGTPELAKLGLSFAIVPSTLDARDVAPPLQRYLKDLTVCANAAAASLACGSILAGHTSEADEFGDIAIWLGNAEYGRGHELDALMSLGLQPLVSAEGEVEEVKISPHSGLPITVHAPDDANAEVARLRELLHRLADPRIFCTRASLSVYLLLGRYEAGVEAGWAGLLGVGVES